MIYSDEKEVPILYHSNGLELVMRIFATTSTTGTTVLHKKTSKARTINANIH